MTVLPSQLGRAFATSRCSPNGTARMMCRPRLHPAALATARGPIARACGANAPAGRRLATVTYVLAKPGEGLTDLSEPGSHSS